jgi:sugar O-acyltransferase (sialic acid O-acetyltransferase NeuD family)
MSGGALLLAGAGRFAEEVTDLALDCGIDVAAWIEGIDPARADSNRRPPVIWVDDQAAFRPDLPFAPAIGAVARRALVERLCREGRALASIVHPSAVIARSAVIEPGCVIFPNVVVGARTRIGQGTIVNRGALVGHHTTIGAGSFLGPGANVAGGVVLGEEVYIGMAGVVRDDRSVAARAVVGAGAVVVKDVDPGVTVVGLPARPMEPR